MIRQRAATAKPASKPRLTAAESKLLKNFRGLTDEAQLYVGKFVGSLRKNKVFKRIEQQPNDGGAS